MESLILKAAKALRDDKTGSAEISEATLEKLARSPSEPMPRSSVSAYEVATQYRGQDEVLRVIVRVVMAGSEESAKAKAARLGNFPEACVRSVHKVDAIARFASSAADLVDSAEHNISGYYNVDKTLLRQTRDLAVVACQQLV